MFHKVVCKDKLGKFRESEVEFKWKWKRKYSKHSFTPKTFHRGDLFPITMTINSTTIRLLTINDGEDLMPIKFRSFFKYKLHPSTGDQIIYIGLVGSDCFWTNYQNDWNYYNNPSEYKSGISGFHSIYNNGTKGVRKWKFRFCKVNI